MHAANHFKSFDHRFFHNCVYGRLYNNISLWQGDRTGDMLKKLGLELVGDLRRRRLDGPQRVAPHGSAIDHNHRNTISGLEWLQRIRTRVPNSIWLNPAPRRHWNEPSIRIVHQVFPMFELTIDGLTEAVDVLLPGRGRIGWGVR